MTHLARFYIAVLILLTLRIAITERMLDFGKFLTGIENHENCSKDVVFAFDGSDGTESHYRSFPPIVEYFTTLFDVTRIAIVISSPIHVIHSDYMTSDERNSSCRLRQSKWKNCHRYETEGHNTSFEASLKKVGDLLSNSDKNAHRMAILVSDRNNATKIQSHLTEDGEKNGSVVIYAIDHSGEGSGELNMTAESCHIFLVNRSRLTKELHDDLHKISAKCPQKRTKYPCRRCLNEGNNAENVKSEPCYKRTVRKKRSSLAKSCKDSFCQNGGTCINTATGIVCKCSNVYTGKTCGIKIVNCSSNPCKNGGECIDHVNGFKCCCGSNYAGKTCERKVTKCDTTHCFNGGTCIDKPDGFQCKCLKGFSGTRCEKSDGSACVHLGKVYANGAKWNEECNNCVCHNSRVTCKPKKCPDIRCKNIEAEVTPKGECCKKCVADSERCLDIEDDCTFQCKLFGNNYACSCPTGMRLASNNNSCIDSAYCKDSGGIYMDKEEWMTNCETCHCDRGEVVCRKERCPPANCQVGERRMIIPGQCCETCVRESATCSLFRGGDISTFDGYKYSFSGRCRYVLSKDCVRGKFSIEYEDSPNKAEKRAIHIFVRCLEIEISPSGKILIEKEEISIPYLRSNLVRILPGPGSRYFSTVIFNTIDSITIIWKSSGDVAIMIPSTYKGTLCGLCGNFNGDSGDDTFNEKSLPPAVEMDTAFQPIEYCSIQASAASSTSGNITVPFPTKSVPLSGISVAEGITDDFTTSILRSEGIYTKHSEKDFGTTSTQSSVSEDSIPDVESPGGYSQLSSTADWLEPKKTPKFYDRGDLSTEETLVFTDKKFDGIPTADEQTPVLTSRFTSTEKTFARTVGDLSTKSVTGIYTDRDIGTEGTFLSTGDKLPEITGISLTKHFTKPYSGETMGTMGPSLFTGRKITGSTGTSLPKKVTESYGAGSTGAGTINLGVTGSFVSESFRGSNASRQSREPEDLSPTEEGSKFKVDSGEVTEQYIGRTTEMLPEVITTLLPKHSGTHDARPSGISTESYVSKQSGEDQALISTEEISPTTGISENFTEIYSNRTTGVNFSISVTEDYEGKIMTALNASHSKDEKFPGTSYSNEQNDTTRASVPLQEKSTVKGPFEDVTAPYPNTTDEAVTESYLTTGENFSATATKEASTNESVIVEATTISKKDKLFTVTGEHSTLRDAFFSTSAPPFARENVSHTTVEVNTTDYDAEFEEAGKKLIRPGISDKESSAEDSAPKPLDIDKPFTGCPADDATLPYQPQVLVSVLYCVILFLYLQSSNIFITQII